MMEIKYPLKWCVYCATVLKYAGHDTCCLDHERKLRAVNTWIKRRNPGPSLSLGLKLIGPWDCNKPNRLIQ